MLPLIPSLQAVPGAASLTGPSASQPALSPFGGALTASSTDASSGAFGSFGTALQTAAGLSPSLTPGLTPGLAPVGAAAGTTGTSAPFSDLLVQSVTQVDQLERAAQTSIEGLLSGKGVDVHEAMIATEKAEMGFDMAVAVRDKAISAYQQVMGMQF